MRRLPSGKWQARYFDASGRRHTAGTFGSEHDARRELARVEVGIDRGDWIDPEAGNVNFEKFVADYLETRSANLQPTTMSGYRSSLKHLLPTFGQVRIKNITPLLVEKWWAQMTKSAAGPQVRRAAYVLLSGSMRAAVRWGMILNSPCKIEGAFKDGSRPRPHLSAEQYAVIVGSMPEHYRVIFWTMLGAHLRLGELVGLNAGDFDPKVGTITVERQATPGDGGVELRATKTGTSRTVEVLEPALGMLRAYVAARPAHPKAPLFIGGLGTRISRSVLRAVWNRARVVAGLDWAHMHDVRHTGLTLVAAFASVAETMARGGHSSSAAAMRYQHAARSRDSVVAKAAGAELASLVGVGT
ncbi:putative prophage phiRv2 integrase [Pseudolysinimonas yzui]|uniref:Putative prophage phiRv2 integrase n=1 Tax=Pseudolysinimonas yzui TaxID=2708254 RepID=A0A8J3M3E9_9MICO|nr:putative prophage phiRv2 integrase [Pseudolysinimonas yzui]